MLEREALTTHKSVESGGGTGTLTPETVSAALCRETATILGGLSSGKSQWKNIPTPPSPLFILCLCFPLAKPKWESQGKGKPLMAFLQFPWCRVRSAESGLRVGVNKRYLAHLSHVSSMICVKNTKTCESSLYWKSLQFSARGSYYHLTYIMREIRGGCHRYTGEPH